MQSWLEGKKWVGKCAQATGMTQAWEYSQAKPVQTFRRASQGVNWSWSQCIKSHHTQTSSGKGLSSHFWNRNNVKSILPGLRRKRTGLLLSGPKSSFQMKGNVAFFSSGSQRRRSLSLPVLTLIFPALLPCLVRDSLCTALQTKILWINWSLNAIDTMETWVSGNLTALTERSEPAIRWRVGEVANRVSCSSFRGGHWYLPIRNHDNRYFADWIRLFPGLSKNSENGNSCPKPHKAARMIEAVGRAVSIETEL